MENWKRILLKAVGVGIGIGVCVTVCALTLYWWSQRPKPWTDSAISAKDAHLVVQMSGEEVHLEVSYAVTNHTKDSYTLPAPLSGTLLRRNPEDKSLVKLDDATWDDTLIIPPGQTFNEKFTITYKLEDYSTSAAELNQYGPDEDKDMMSKAYRAFVDRRMNEIDGFVFYDYISHYRIERPRSWDLKPSKP
jgi:hypothetical protein